MGDRYYLEQQNLGWNYQPRTRAKDREIPTFFKLLNEGKVNLSGYSKLPECKTKFKEVVLNSKTVEVKNVWDLFSKSPEKKIKNPKVKKFYKKENKKVEKKEEIKCSENINNFFNDFLAGKYKS